MNDTEIILLVIVCAIVVFFIFALIIDYHDRKKEKKKYKKHLEELKIGNKYKMKKFTLFLDDNPFIDETYIVEIIDIKVNNKNKLYVQYKQIEPEYKGKPFSDPFKEFIVFYDLIK
jgi:flagellar basal body-associated protein FliL